MSVTDPIADMLTRIRNAGMAGKRVVEIPSSNVKKGIADILIRHQYIRKYVIIDDGKQGILKILLRYAGHDSAIQGIERASLPGRRYYSGAKGLAKVKNGLGLSIVSTNKGLLTDTEAREQNVGGEVLCRVW